MKEVAIGCRCFLQPVAQVMENKDSDSTAGESGFIN